MAFISVFALVLATGPYHWLIRLTLLGGSLLMLIAMAYAGSRTPFILLPAALLFYTILTFNKKVILAAGLIGLLGTALVLKSTSNPVLFRIQSAFRLKDSEDTIGVRMRNQEKVQPFILAHPFGAGLGSTGVWGKRFTPDSWLASFAHDSGYVRIAVEMGWIGLLLYLGLLFVVLKQAVYYYFRVRDPEIKNLYLGLSTAIFMLVVANYPQEAIVQLPMSILFYVMLALIARLKDFDPNFSSTSTIS
jgi:O-antigen ligase